jgi:DNA polymerase-3 subunit gamma/tau
LSYEVIARRWRPQDFGGLIGQDHIRTTLQNALKNGRLHHALLFTGPRGTGKTSSARILAKSLRCPNAVDFVPCNKCSECEEIATGRSLNVVEIDGASNNGVDAIRELLDTVGYLPSSGHYKLYIIDEVHMLSTSAFNALLKTLEEPPEHVYFVMATTEAHKIPNTILSRCQRFDFRRIPSRVIADHLQTICERDGVKFETDALWTIARQADGSMRDAQSLLDQVINFTNGDLKRELVVSTLGLTDRALLMEIFTAIVQRQTSGAIEGLKRLHQSGADAKLFLLDLMELIRHTLLLRLEPSAATVDLPDSERTALLELGAALTPEDLHFLFDMALKGAQDLARAADTLLVLEMVILRMAGAPTVNAFSGVSGPQAKIETASRPRPAQPAQPAPQAQPQAAPTPTPQRPSGPAHHQFQKLVEKVKEVNALLAAQLENCFVIGFQNSELILGISNKHKFLFDKIDQADSKKKILNYMNSFWGPGHKLTIQLAEPAGETAISPKDLAKQQEQNRQENLRKAVEEHPLVRSAQNVFKAEIKSIKEIKS